MAIKTAGTVVYMQSGALASSKVITNITQATEAVVSSTSHGYTNGDVIKITGVGGMQQINKRAFVIKGTTDSPAVPNAFTLTGVNSTNFTAFTSSSPETGIAQKATMLAVGEVRDLPEMGGTEPNEFDVSHLLSISEEKLAGLPKQSNISFNVWFDLDTAMHNQLILANQDLEDRVFKFYKAGSFNLTVVAQVGGFKITGGDVNSAYSGTVTLLPRASGAWSLA